MTRITLTVTVPRRPLLAGIDPYHLLDWEERADDGNMRVSRSGAELTQAFRHSPGRTTISSSGLERRRTLA